MNLDSLKDKNIAASRRFEQRTKVCLKRRDSRSHIFIFQAVVQCQQDNICIHGVHGHTKQNLHINYHNNYTSASYATNIPFKMQSALKWSSQTYILFLFIRSFSSEVISLVLRIILSHSSRLFFFSDAVCSLCLAFTTGI